MSITFVLPPFQTCLLKHMCYDAMMTCISFLFLSELFTCLQSTKQNQTKWWINTGGKKGQNMLMIRRRAVLTFQTLKQLKLNLFGLCFVKFCQHPSDRGTSSYVCRWVSAFLPQLNDVRWSARSSELHIDDNVLLQTSTTASGSRPPSP